MPQDGAIGFECKLQGGPRTPRSSLRTQPSNLDLWGKIPDCLSALAMTLLMQWWRLPQRCRPGEGRAPYPRVLLGCTMVPRAATTTLTRVMAPGLRRDDTNGVATSER